MLKNYLLTALRNLRHARLFSLINILGLSIGISASVVIYLIVHFDLSFENFQPNRDHIYRIVTDANFSGELYHLAGTPNALPAVAAKELTGIRELAPIFMSGVNVSIPRPGHSTPTAIKQSRIVYTDARYFKLFNSYTWLAGTPASLNTPYHTVLSASRAALYFPGLLPQQIIGKTIIYADTVNTIVCGIIGDPPINTDLQWQEFLSFPTLAHTGTRFADPNDWFNYTDASECFVDLAPGTKPADIDRQLKQLEKKYIGQVMPGNEDAYTYHLQPLTDIHFSTLYSPFFRRSAHKPTLYGLMLIAAFLLTLACINFINLTTAQASRRAKEIGIRKTFGGARSQLLFQFLGETFLLTLLSLALSLCLTPLLLRLFADFIPKEIHFDPLHSSSFWLFLFILLITVTLLAGFYPSWILSRFQPIQVLRNQAMTNAATTRSGLIRKVLTVFQFTIAQAFIIGTLTVGRQIHYALTADLGFKKDAIIYFQVPFAHGKDQGRNLLLQRIQLIPGVQRAGLAGGIPEDLNATSTQLAYSDGKKKLDMQIQQRYADSNYIHIYHLPLLAGRNLRSSDSTTEMLINRTYCTILGFKNPADAIGKTITDGSQPVPIVGVIADFHQGTLHTAIKPLVISCSNNDQFSMQIALRPQTPDGNGWKNTIARIGKAYTSIYPKEDFSFEFFDETIAKFYTTDEQLSKLLRWATALTIFISCLGLAGLVIFTTNVRTREIGIRKVLGASIATIISLLSKEFVKLLIIAFLIASPIAWWAVHTWLETFAYRIPVSWWIFPLAGITMMGIALLTMSVRTIRAASANPVEALRSE